MSKLSKQKLRERFLKNFNNSDASPLEHVRSQLSEADLIPTITNFIAEYPSFSKSLFDVHGNVPHLGSRLGRGEVLVWFIYDSVTLGGSSSSIDVFLNNEPAFEIKCATHEGSAYKHFMLGIDEVQASLKHFYRILKLFEKAEKAGKLLIPQNFANISSAKIKELKQAYPITYKNSEEQYFNDLFSGPIGQKKFLFFDRHTSLPIFFGTLSKDNLEICRISGGLSRLAFKP